MITLFAGVVNASSGNNVSNISAASKTSPSTAKNTPKDQKLFTNAKPIDPAWLAQTKMETANIVNANKLLVRKSCSFYFALSTLNYNSFCV